MLAVFCAVNCKGYAPAAVFACFLFLFGISFPDLAFLLFTPQSQQETLKQEGSKVGWRLFMYLPSLDVKHSIFLVQILSSGGEFYPRTNAFFDWTLWLLFNVQSRAINHLFLPVEG